MQDVSTAGSSVWNLETSQESSPSPSPAVEDLLPPFATLTTDEDRERKAELQHPGTYHVVANPRSFTSLPEYRDSSASLAASDRILSSEIVPTENTEDPNVVILKTFNEQPRKVSTLSLKRSNSPRSPASSQASAAHSPLSLVQSSFPSRRGSNLSMLDIARSGGKDGFLLLHYRNSISPLLIQAEKSDNDEDIFEIQARSYPPLFHAMMALAALSNANQTGGRIADALEHYQSVIPALQATVQSSRDSYSDGAFFTHFLLLLYETAAAGDRDSNMWQHQMDQLLRIITLRQQTFGSEQYGFIVWTIVSADVYATLSMSGKGVLAEALHQSHRIPPPEACLPLGPTGSFHSEETHYFPAILKLDQEVVLLGLQIGQLAQALREEALQRRHGSGSQRISEERFVMERKTRVQNLHRMIRQSKNVWQSEHIDYYRLLSEPRPARVFARIVHSCCFSRACVIYSYTCLYPNQVLDMDRDIEDEIEQCSTEIIDAGCTVVLAERFDLQSIIFALSLAATSTKDPKKKLLALETIRTMGQHSHSRAVKSGRSIVERIFEKQALDGQATHMDWVEETELSGQRLVFRGI